MENYVAILIAILAVAFAAFCVWLTVRIVNRRERWAKWTAALVVGLPVLYVLSIGPAQWLYSRNYLPIWILDALEPCYAPLRVLAYGPSPVAGAIWWYLSLWTAPVH